MNKSFPVILVSFVALIILGVGAMVVFLPSAPVPAPISQATTTPNTLLGSDPKNATYTIDGTPITLTNGLSVVEAAPGSASKITTKYFGNEVVRDLNGDGRPDTAFILTQDAGGSGTFYYAVAALNTPTGYIGSQGFLLGDRIAPQATTMGTSTIVIFNYAERKEGESFAVAPSVGKSVWLKLDPSTMQFVEVVQKSTGK